MKRTENTYEIDDDPSRLDFARVHLWLTGSYWSPGITREKVEQSARYSALVVGAYQGSVQVGYMRVISDRTRFAYLADVFVDEEHRKRGLAKAIVRFALEHPNFVDVNRWVLATADAHEVYRGVGFGPLPIPDRWMMLYRDQN